METYWSFEKNLRFQYFKDSKFGLKISEILQKCYCNVHPQGIAFTHLVRANEVLIT